MLKRLYRGSTWMWQGQWDSHWVSHLRLSKDQLLKTKEEQKHMRRTSYVSAIERLMYAMIGIKLDIEHAVGCGW